MLRNTSLLKDKVLTTWILPVLCHTLLAGCSGAPDPQPLPPQTVTTAAIKKQAPVALTTPLPEIPTAVAAAAPEEDANKPPHDDGSLVVIRTKTGAPGETTNRDLVQAARQERERRKTASPIAVVDDDNLSEHASGGQLTVGNPRAVPEAEVAEARETLDRYKEQEEYWRRRARDIRQRWRDAYDSLEGLEEETAELRRKFYAEEDAAFRDREIKPAWDRSQDLLREAKKSIESAREELDILYGEGRRAGALEGWLRAGIELEPWPEDGKVQDEAPPVNERNPSEQL